MHITYLNPVHCQVNIPDKKVLDSFLNYTGVFWQQGQYRKVKREYKKSVTAKNGIFLTGFLPRIERYCQDKGLPLSLEGTPFKVDGARTPQLPGITFREDQLFMSGRAVDIQRGLLLSPTGSGKTVIACGIMSCFPSAKFLFLCHTLTLIRQTVTEMERFGFTDIGVIAEGQYELGHQYTVATVQSLSRMDPEEYMLQFDGVIVDEAHHVSALDGTYAKVLSHILAPIRLGFTATEPQSEEAKLACEGLLGEVIGEIPIETGVEMGFLARPKVTLVDVPLPAPVLDMRHYQDIYQKGIVENRMRNHLIAKIVEDRCSQGGSVLILVNKILHGNLLEEAINTKMAGPHAVFIQGSTEGEVREQLRLALHNKTTNCVIATAIWKEGVNIPSLNTIISAGGGRSEISTLQAVGRGLRVAEGKEFVEIVDFLDKGKYLADHTVQRLSLYVRNGWLEAA
jgi:superfamily II DNA or RNA helicase